MARECDRGVQTLGQARPGHNARKYHGHVRNYPNLGCGERIPTDELLNRESLRTKALLTEFGFHVIPIGKDISIKKH